MAGDRTLTVTILGNAKGAQKAFAEVEQSAGALSSRMEAVGSKFSSVGQKMQSVGAKMTVGVTAPLALLGKTAFDAASDLNESMSKVGVVFGDSAKDVQAWAATSAKSMGMSRQAALEAAGTFGNFLQAMKVQPAAAKDMSKSLVALAADLASFNNSDPAEVLLALRSGLAGETEPLRKFGVSLSAARVQAEAMAMGIKTSYNEMSAAQKATISYKIILDDTKMAQGDFARTATGAANQQRILAAEFKDAAATLGAVLLPIVTDFISWLRDLADKFQSLSPHMQKMVVIGIAIAAAIGPVVTIVGALATAIGVLLSPVGLVIAAIALLAIGVIYAYNHFEGFRDVVNAIGHLLQDTILPIYEEAFKKAFSAIRFYVETVIEVIKFMMPAIKLLIDVALKMVEDFTKGAAKAFGWVPGIGDDLRKAAKGVEKFRDEVNAALDGIRPGAVALTMVAGGAGLQHFAGGGWVKGPPGAAVPVIAHVGERVQTAAQAAASDSGGRVIHNVIVLDGRQIYEAMKPYARADARAGSRWQ